MLGATNLTPFLRLLCLLVADLAPCFVPAITAHCIAQTQHGIYLRASLMHTRTFQTRFHNQLVAALYSTATQGPTLFLAGWILHLCFPFL